MADRFLIAPYDSNSGLQNNVRPWLIPDQAFSALNNAYVFRGRVRKRFGSIWTGNSQLNSRARVPLVPAVLTVTTPSNITVGQMFSIGTDIFTVTNITAPYPKSLLSTSAVTAQLVAANQVTFSAIAGTVYWYPALPIMGLLTYETGSVINQPTIAFDTKYAYQYDSVTLGWNRLSSGTSTWTGSNSQFFWGATWSGANAYDKLFFVTNFDQADTNYMRYWDGSTWTSFQPAIDGTNFLNNARILVVFRNRLLALNTWEGVDTGNQNNYVNRCRYSQVGDPRDTNAWRQDLPGRGSAIDAPTTEAIVTVEFVKDRLIVYFERSTYELAYTGNQAYPFVWNKLNTELGAESTNSIVPFDQFAFGVGSTGIHSCNGSNVARIDDLIPQEVFDIHNSDGGVQRVYGIRDYTVEMIYWTFPDTESDSTFPYPNKILVYNYKTGTWSFNDDSFTAFGYFVLPTTVAAVATWSSTTVTWNSSESWSSGTLQSGYRQVLAGNQEGYIVIVDADATTNAPALQITNATYSGSTVTFTVVDHNLRDGDYVLIQNLVSSGNLATTLNNTIYYVEADPAQSNTFTITEKTGATLTGTYNGGGTLSRVSKIDIKTKEYNFYEKEGRNASISKVDFMVDKTSVGQLQVDYYISTSDIPLVQDSIADGAIMGTSVLETFAYPTLPYEATSSRVIHPVYVQSDGEFIQLQLTFNDDQITSVTTNSDGTITGPALEDFQLHFMCIYAQKTSYRFQ